MIKLLSALAHMLNNGHQAQAYLQALAAPAGSAPVLGGVTALNRVAVFFADYSCLDVVPAHVVNGALTRNRIERRRSASVFRWEAKKLATYVTWRHIVGWVFLSRRQSVGEQGCWLLMGGKSCWEVRGLYRSSVEPGGMTMFGKMFVDQMS